MILIEEHNDYLKIVENIYGYDDLGPQFDSYLNINNEVTPEDEIVTSASILNQYLDDQGNVREGAAEELFAELDIDEETQKELGVDDLMGGGYWTGETRPSVRSALLYHGQPETIGRSPATALRGEGQGGGLFYQGGQDSPYYNAFYESFEDSFDELVRMEDPFGPNFLYLSGMKSEWEIPELLKRKYGDEAYNIALERAEEAGKKAQFDVLDNILEMHAGKTGKDKTYYETLRVLDVIERGEE